MWNPSFWAFAALGTSTEKRPAGGFLHFTDGRGAIVGDFKDSPTE